MRWWGWVRRLGRFFCRVQRGRNPKFGIHDSGLRIPNSEQRWARLIHKIAACRQETGSPDFSRGGKRKGRVFNSPFLGGVETPPLRCSGHPGEKRAHKRNLPGRSRPAARRSYTGRSESRGSAFCEGEPWFEGAGRPSLAVFWRRRAACIAMK